MSVGSAFPSPGISRVKFRWEVLYSYNIYGPDIYKLWDFPINNEPFWCSFPFCLITEKDLRASPSCGLLFTLNVFSSVGLHLLQKIFLSSTPANHEMLIPVLIY